MNPIFVDISGRPLSVGDYVIYVHNESGRGDLDYAVVTAVKTKPAQDHRGTPYVKVWLNIRATDRDYSGLHLKPKVQVVEGSRVLLKVTRDQIPNDVLILLDGVAV